MNETSQQYIGRLLGYLNGRDPLPILKRTPVRIKTLIMKRSRRLLTTRPAPGKWSVGEIIAHLAETEIVMAWRYRSVAEKSGVTIQSFEQDDWAKNSRYQTSDIGAMLNLFTTLRSANIAFLTGLPKRTLANFGMHQERGKETLTHIMRLEAGHDLNHLRQIEAILTPARKAAR